MRSKAKFIYTHLFITLIVPAAYDVASEPNKSKDAEANFVGDK